jgi:hypothetical protein
VSIRGRNCLPSASTRGHPRFFRGVRVADLSSFLCCDFKFLSLSSVPYLPNVACVSGLFIIAFPSVFSNIGDRDGRNRMVVGFTTTCEISAYHH